MYQAALDVILEQQEGHLVGRRGQCLDLLQYVQAVRLFGDEPLNTAGLALDPLQPVDKQASIFGVGVAKVCWFHTAGEYVASCRQRSIGAATASVHSQ